MRVVQNFWAVPAVVAVRFAGQVPEGFSISGR